MNRIKSGIFLLLIFLFFHPALVFSNGLIKEGVLDLRETGFSQSKIISLKGDWQFYWNKFVDPDVFNCNKSPVPDLYGNVPSYWTEYSLNGENLSSFGYASYHLLILLPQGFREKLLLSAPVFDSSFKLYINGVFAGGNGQAGISAELSKPEYKPFLVNISPQSDSLDILVHVSNFQHRRGGFWKQMKIGLSEPFYNEHQRYNFSSYLSMGVLMAFSLFFFFFFIFYRKDFVPLFFSLFLLGILIRLMCSGIFPIKMLFNISWDWTVRLEYLGVFLAGVAGSWFFHSLWPLKFMKRVHLVNTTIIVIFSVFVLFLKVNVFAYSMIYFQIVAITFMIFYLVYGFITIFTKGLINIVYFTAMLVFFLALVNDIILANSFRAVTRDYMLHISVQIFTFLHAIMLIRSWIRAFIEKERLNKEIEYLNANLGNLISERTMELEERNRLVLVQNEKIAIQNTQLKDEIDFKNRFFSIIAHDLKSPIASLLIFFEVIKGDVDQKTKDNALASIQKLAISAYDLIENLLYWGRSQGNQISVNNRETNLEGVIIKVISLFQEPAAQKRIQINSKVEGNTMSICDPELLQIILRNLVSNAIKFTEPGGLISLSIEPDKNDKTFLRIAVKDTGTGFPEEKLKLILEGKNPGSSYGTQKEKGTGLGLSIVIDLVKLINGKFDWQSISGGGTTFYILVPASLKN